MTIAVHSTKYVETRMYLKSINLIGLDVMHLASAFLRLERLPERPRVKQRSET